MMLCRNLLHDAPARKGGSATALALVAVVFCVAVAAGCRQSANGAVAGRSPAARQEIGDMPTSVQLQAQAAEQASVAARAAQTAADRASGAARG